jgi:hypothetical protein
MSANTGFNNHVGRGNPGNRGGDDFIAGADASDAQGDFHGAGAGIEGAHRTAAEILGQLRFERLHLGAAGNPTGTQDIADRCDRGFVDGGFGKRQEGLLAHIGCEIRCKFGGNGGEISGELIDSLCKYKFNCGSASPRRR